MVVMGRKRFNRSYYFTKSFEKLKMMKSRLSFIGQFLFWPDAKNGKIFSPLDLDGCSKILILLSEKD